MADQALFFGNVFQKAPTFHLIIYFLRMIWWFLISAKLFVKCSTSAIYTYTMPLFLCPLDFTVPASCITFYMGVKSHISTPSLFIFFSCI